MVFGLSGIAKRYTADAEGLVHEVEAAHAESLRRAGCLDASAPLAPPGGTILKAPAPCQRFMPRTGVMYVAGSDNLVRDIAVQDIDKLIKAGCTPLFGQSEVALRRG
jgi:hypothetical protein